MSALRTGRFYLQRRIPGIHFCWRLSRSQVHNAAGRIKSMENLKDPIGNRNRDLPACSAVQCYVTCEPARRTAAVCVGLTDTSIATRHCHRRSAIRTCDETNRVPTRRILHQSTTNCHSPVGTHPTFRDVLRCRAFGPASCFADCPPFRASRNIYCRL